MAKKTIPPPKEKTVLLIPLDQAKERVYRQLDKGNEILNIEIRNEEELHQAQAKHSSWSEYTEELLKQLSNTDQIARKFARVYAVAFISSGTPPLPERISKFRSMVQRNLQHLASVYEQLELFPIAQTGIPNGEVNTPRDISSRSESVTINNYGTIYNPQIQQGTTKSSQEAIVTSADIKPLLDQLAQAVENMSLALPEEIARQVRQDLSVLIGEASSHTARKEWWQLSVDGLKRAATDVGEIGKPVIELVSRIVPLLLAISNT